jgi:TolB-like protein/tetratricopeptide (TPR) repeat protein/tRNA A-37 threonylcarbamoyl transferase component Bud32
MLRLDSPERLQAALHDAYVIERELGGGGMSRTYVARETALDRRVVLKVLPPDLAATVSHDRFRREILTIASLQHPNIVGILATDEVDGLPYFTMPFVEGESLRLRLERHGPMSVAQSVTILRDVARALTYAHERGVVHRDIKPDNVLLATGAAVVADFGVAKALSTARAASDAPAGSGSITGAGMALGTPAYMAPEQAAGDPNADVRADLYAFGVMAYEMLTGATPFGARSPAQLMAAHISEQPAHVALARPQVPRALAELVMQCLEKDPLQRPESAAAIAQALEDPAMVSGAFASSPAVPVVPTVAVPAPRSWGRVALLSAVGVIGAFLLWQAAGPPGAGPPGAAPAAAGAPDARAIAVMPLVSLSADSTDEYLAAGMTDELASALVRLGDFKVVSRSAAQLVQQRGATPAEIGRELGVAYLLEGTVQRQGDRIRVTTRLVDVADGFTVWSDVYDRAGVDLFAVQDELARSVVDAVGEELGMPPATQLASDAPPVVPLPAGTSAPLPLAARRALDPVAYDHFLRARALQQRRDDGALAAALREYESAVRRDSTFARAWAGIATVQAQVARAATTVPSARAAASRGREAAERAIRLDPRLAEGYAARGILELITWEFAGAERDLARALELDREDAVALQGMGELRLLQGDGTGATDALRRAERADPASTSVGSFRAFARQLTGNMDSALAVAERAAEAAPTQMTPRWVFGTILLDAGRSADAIRELEVARSLAPTSPSVLGSLGAAYAVDGQRALAEAVLAQLREQPDVPRFWSATAKIMMGLGERDSALVFLQRAADQRDPVFVTEPLTLHLWDPVRDDPRFQAIVAQVGLRGERLPPRRPPPPNSSRDQG